MKKKTVEDDRIAITAQMLVKAKACRFQVDLFRQKYGDKMIPNARTMKRVSGLSVGWAARHLLHDDYLSAFNEGWQKLNRQYHLLKRAVYDQQDKAMRHRHAMSLAAFDKAYREWDQAFDKCRLAFWHKTNYLAVWCWIAQQTGVSKTRLRKQIKTLY